VKTATAGDQVNGGAGTDTLKYYADAAAGFHAQVLPQISGIEALYMKGGIADDDQTLDVTTIAGLTSVELDTPAAALDIAAGKFFTVKTTAAQTVQLDNFNAAAGKLGNIALTNATNLTVNNVGADTTNTGVVSIDVANTTATSATITTATAASKVTLLNSSTKLATLNVAGDKNLTLTEDLTTLKTINASTATGNVSVIAAGATGLNGVDAKLDAAFAFTGGSGNDTLKLTQASLQALTAGSQLDAGAGSKDTLFVIANNKAAADLAFVSADYKAINATKGFEKLAIEAGVAKAATVDASLLTSIKHFGVSAVTNTISKVNAGSTLDIDAATTLTTVTGAVGVKDLTINIGSDTATAATANTALDITGLTDVTINANIKAGVTGATHKVGTLTHSDNSTFTIKGNGDFEIALGAATVTGSKVDGSASTGKLTITGGSAALDLTKASLGDVLIGGAGADTIKASLNGGSLTGNGGNDVFDVTAAVVGAGPATPITLITDFTKGDGIKFQGSAAIVEKIDLSGLAAGKTDLEVITAIASAATTAVNDIVWGTYNGNTYVFNEVATAGGITATDIAVKLTGVLDLSTSTLNTTTDILTFA